jgi:hypothetical protein
MTDLKAFKKEVESYFGGSDVTSRRDDPRRRDQPTQRFLAHEMYTDPATLNRKLNGTSKQYLTGPEVRDIGSILIYWKRITRRKQLQHLFEHVGYTLSDDDWSNEPWKSLIDDSQPPKVEILPLRNASFEDWKNEIPAKWLCNTKAAGWIVQVPGRATGSKALEIGGYATNREWVYCRTRETQELPVMPNSRVSLSFWAKRTQEGSHPERSKNVEVSYYDGFGWQWLFAQELAEVADEWMHYETEWWPLSADAQKIAVGVVVYKDGAFHVDDLELRIREGVPRS